MIRLEGEQFETITDLTFTYTTEGNVFRTDRANQDISRSGFEKVIEIGLPLEGPGSISKLVRGSAYVCAVLHDCRVRQANW